MELPASIGAGGLIGRQQIARDHDLVQPISYEEDGTPVYAEPPHPGHTIPPNCLRVLNSPLPLERGGGCNHDCPGKARDGACLLEKVREANECEIEWSFDIDADGYWFYNGPELPTQQTDAAHREMLAYEAERDWDDG